MNYQAEESATNTEQETAEEQSPSGGLNEEEKHHKSSYDQMGELQPDEMLRNSLCTRCGNRRPKIGGKKDFTYAELQAATEGFCPKNFLSKGGFGSVFRGQLKNGPKIAVKQHKHASFQGEKEFKSEVNVLSKARHENVVMLLGSCSEGNHRLLVYEYVCNGSLDQHLSSKNKPNTEDKFIFTPFSSHCGCLVLYYLPYRDMKRIIRGHFVEIKQNIVAGYWIGKRGSK